MADNVSDVHYEVHELPHVRNQIRIDLHGKCAKCFFWQTLKNGYPTVENNVRGRIGDNIGECRFNPPAGSIVEQEWPVTYEFDWCGEFKPRAGTGGLAGKL